LPLLATASSDKKVLVYSLQTFQLHSTIDNGHKRSVRCAAWKPGLPAGQLALVSGSFDSTAGVWRRDENAVRNEKLEINVASGEYEGDDEEEEPHDWEFSLVLEGHDSEIKGVAFSPSGQFLATCSRDKSVWIWEDIGGEGEDEWETVAVLQEHEGDVKFVSWCPDDSFGDLLASASYDDQVRLWREDSDGEWGCVAVLSGHEGTVWAVDWEPQLGKKGRDVEEEDYSSPKKPLRLITCSSDETIRVWRKTSSPESSNSGRGNGVPSVIRRSTSGEKWICEATLPKVHDRPIYSVAWSKKTGRVVSTGSDSRVVVYEERPKSNATVKDTADAAATTNGDHVPTSAEDDATPNTEWHVLTTLELAHGPYEINNATWCARFDGGRKGEEEMLITTGDDGVVKAWAIEE
jgi:WD40 repeat protein